MSWDQARRRPITENLRFAYEAVTAEPVPVAFQNLLWRMDGNDDQDDDLDPGVGAEPPRRPSGGPKSNAAAARQDID
jgi:hypothetical protein